MSVAVPLEGLRAAIAERASAAYLLTVSDDGGPHVVHVPMRWEGDVLAATVGKGTARNAAARPAVALVFPVRTAGDYSLIVDGTATSAPAGEKNEVRITPTRATLHRPAAVPDPASACGADCVPILPSADRSGS